MNLDSFLNRLESDRSKEHYHRVLSEIGEFSPEGVSRWWRSKRTLTPSSRRNYAFVLSSYLKFTAKKDEQARELLEWFKEAIKLPPRSRSSLRQAKRTITEAEYQKIRKSAGDTTKQLALEVLWRTALRVSTMLNLSQKCLVEDAEGRHWLVFTTKGQKELTLPCPRDLFVRLSRLNGDWFPWTRGGFDKFLRKLGRRVLGKDISAHDFRRSRITLWYRGGLDLVNVSRLAGHASVQTTADVYIQPDIEKIFVAVEK